MCCEVYAFIDAHRAQYPVLAMCALLGVSRSAYHAWRGRGPSARECENTRLLAHIRAIHAASHGSYGSPRVHRELGAQGQRVSLNRVRRLMQQNDIAARHNSRHYGFAPPPAGSAEPARAALRCRARPDQVWLADVSYVWTDQGWLYLACVLHLHSRAIVGWAMSERNDRHLAIAALAMAYFRRRPARGLIHHSDRGSPHCSHDYQKLLTQYGMVCSMSRKGDCYDNAPVESWFKSLKVERVNGRRYATREQARSDIFSYVETFYNDASWCPTSLCA